MHLKRYRTLFLYLAIITALLLPVMCEAAAQSRAAAISEDERLKKAVEAVIIFHEKSGNPVLAGRIKSWYASGYIKIGTRSALNSVGLNMDDADPYYWSPTGTIYIPESRLLAAVKPLGAVDFAAITELSGSLAHEMVHANDESMLSRALLTSKSEREMAAYTKTLQSYFAGAYKRNAGVQKKQGGPCDKAGDAQEVNKIIGEFNRYYDAEIAPKNSARQAPMEAKLKQMLQNIQQSENACNAQLARNIGYQSITREREAILSEMGNLSSRSNIGALSITNPQMEALWQRLRENNRKRDVFITTNADLAQMRGVAENWRRQYNKANAEYEAYLKQDVLFPVDNMRIPRLSYDDRLNTPQLQYERDRAVVELQRLQKDPSHSNEVMQRISALQDRISELDRQLQSLTIAEAKKELENLRANMNAIVEQCDKEKKDPKQASASKDTDLLNCMCMACGGMLGGYYTTTGDCAGGCICWGPLTGWCTGIPTVEKQAKYCYGSANKVQNPTGADAQKVLKTVRDINTKTTETAIRKALQDKRLDDAVRIGNDAKKRDPAISTPVFGELSGALKNDGWNAVYQSDYGKAINRLESAVFFNAADADAAKKLDAAKRAQKYQWPQVEAKSKEFYENLYAKKIPSANASMLQMQDLQMNMAGGQANPLWKQVMTDYGKGLAWYNTFSQESMTEWTRLFKAQDWEQAEVHLKKVLSHELFPADQKQYSSSLQLVSNRLGERREAMQYYDTAKANFAKGMPPDVQGLGSVIRELKKREGRFIVSDPRRAQINELAAAMEKRQKVLNARAYAQIHFNDGDMYYRSHNFEPAAGRYAEGLRAIRENGDMSDPLYAKYYKLWNDSVAKDKRFKELYAYAAGLAVTDKPLDESTIQKGIAAAEEGLKIRPRNGDMEIHWNKLKWKLAELKHKQQVVQTCEAKWTDGKALFHAGKHAEALRKFRENIACAPGNREREAYVRQLEDSLRMQASAKQACLAIRQQGDALVKQKKYADAISRYRESLRCQPDPKLEEYIRTLEASLKKQGVSSAAVSPVQVPAQSGQSVSAPKNDSVIFENGNIGGVSNTPTQLTIFTIGRPIAITKITNYHWNGGRGATPGTIGLRSHGGQMYGPWPASGSEGQGGVQNANWHVYPHIILPAGTYTVIDSQPSTWAQNAQSRGCGFSRIEGSITVSSASTASSQTPASGQVVPAKLMNEGRDNVHIFIEGQDTAGPQNRLSPGQGRTITFAPPAAGRIKFVFYRNGQWLGSCYWEYSPDRTPVIRFTEDGGKPRPVCTTHLR